MPAKVKAARRVYLFTVARMSGALEEALIV